MDEAEYKPDLYRSDLWRLTRVCQADVHVCFAANRDIFGSQLWCAAALIAHRRAWSTGLCSIHQVPDLDCGLCNRVVWVEAQRERNLLNAERAQARAQRAEAERDAALVQVREMRRAVWRYLTGKQWDTGARDELQGAVVRYGSTGQRAAQERDTKLATDVVDLLDHRLDAGAARVEALEKFVKRIERIGIPDGVNLTEDLDEVRRALAELDAK